jgi:hypothetical protein
MKEALLRPEKAIKKEITNFMSRGVWKPVSRKMVTEQMKRKPKSTKWNLRRRQNKIIPSDTRHE